MITSTSPATGLLCRSMVPELVNVCTPIKRPCNGPPRAIALLGFPERKILPRAIELGGACHCGERQRLVVGEAIVLAG